MLTPSSNTALEPLTTRMIGDLPHVSAHFGRFRVTEIALTDGALAQFADDEILTAARLLSHAKCDVIAWNGTSSGWLGFAADETLCAEIERATGIPACTSVLALNEILHTTDARTLGLVTPYLDDVQARIIANYRSIGIDIVAESHLGLQDNFSFAEVDEDTLADGVRRVARARPDAIAVFCTNLKAAQLLEKLEAEVDIPCYDTIQTAVWKSLVLCGEDPSQVSGWGSLFKKVPPPLAAVRP